LCHFYTNKLCQLNKPKRGLAIIRKAINNIQHDSNTGRTKIYQLTTVHSDLLQLSLASENFNIALKLLSNDILDINKQANASIDAKYLLLYFYYAGCIYAAMKQFESALFFFEQALTIPAIVLSQIMIESYKKFILVSLISKGKLPLLPKYTSRIVINQIKPICSIYHEIASAFVNYEQEKLIQLSQKYHDIFVMDGNMGLIKQVQQSFNKKNIQKLTKTFITLSLADMALKVKLTSAKEAENLMFNMIKDGEIFANISQKDGNLNFIII
jgi:COP9 signalosome complex subunit 3